MKDEHNSKLIKELTIKFTKDGKLIEAGWVALRLLTTMENTPEQQLNEMRRCYFAGAQHLFSSIMMMLDPGTESTNADLKRLDMINSELIEWMKKERESMT